MTVRLLWQAEDLDRLLDAEHARLVDTVVQMLTAAGWTVLPEVTFQIGSERGSIDILAFHAGAGVLLVVEVKPAGTFSGRLFVSGATQAGTRHRVRGRSSPSAHETMLGS